MPDFTSPDVRNYSVFKGTIYFTPTGGQERQLGNCPSAAFEPAIEKLDHFSSMAGIRSKDRSVVVQKEATLTITIEEMTLENLRLALLGGDIEANTEGNDAFSIMSEAEVTGSVRIEGTNDVGPRYNVEFPNVAFTPSGAVDFIQEDAEWSSVEIVGEVTADQSGSFGTMTLQGSSTE